MVKIIKIKNSVLQKHSLFIQKIYLNRLSGQQINIQIYLKFLVMSCLTINFHKVKKKFYIF